MENYGSRKGDGFMSKGTYEVAAEIVCELLKARGQAIAGIGHAGLMKDLIDKYLSDEAVAKTYKEIFKAVNEEFIS